MTAISEEKIMTDQDLAVLGGGEVAYLREISPKMAKRMLKGATDAAGNPADVDGAGGCRAKPAKKISIRLQQWSAP